MKLSGTLATIATDAKRIRESLTYHASDSAELTQIDEGDRLIVGRETNKQWMKRVLECATLFVDVFEGRRPTWHLKEAMTTSDFPLLFGDLLYRQLLGRYTPWPVSYPAYFKIIELTDFRTMNMYMIDGGGTRLELVAERAPYPETAFTESTKTIRVAKYGKRYSITFEMVINDDLGAFQDRPLIMAEGARTSEEYLAGQMIADAAGPHASFFTVGNANIVTSNPVLSTSALQTALSQLSTKVDADGNPIMIDMVTLVVPPALEITARNILNATELRITSTGPGGSTGTEMITNNWMRGRVNLVVNPFIPIITTTGTVGATSWYLIASSGVTRPAFLFAFLRGRRRPQLFVKDSNQRSLGGGNVGVLEGDFDTDSIDYKVRHIFGAAQGDPKMAMASKGTGS